MIEFEKPDYKITDSIESNFYGKFELEPLERGFGTTIGNALRRVMLSSLPGSAISSVKIDKVQHEFQTIDGVIEDVTNIILNLKQVRFKKKVDEFEEEKISINVSGTEVFKAGDISKHLTGFEVLNPDFVICHIDPKASFQIDLKTPCNFDGYSLKDNQI